MNIKIFSNAEALGVAAAGVAAGILRETITKSGRARIIVATGASQLVFLKTLASAPGIEWACVEMFHLDEYVGLPISHPASFRKYLLERFITPAGIQHYHLLDGEGDLAAVCRNTAAELRRAPIDAAFVGIGENGHLAFNDPPADFETNDPLLVVELDQACRQQQVSEGWFKSLSEVPKRAISMSVRQILSARKILCSVPGERKARAVKDCLEGPISPAAPASILQSHNDTAVFLDTASASFLKQQVPVVS
jgi:glucosamine-6-phosphate deaminase